MTFSALAAQYFAARGDILVDPGRIRRSLANLPEMAGKHVEQIDTAYLSKLMTKRAGRPGTSGIMPTPGTVRRDMIAVQTVMSWGFKQGLLKDCPHVPKPPSPPPKQRFLSPEEIARINEALSQYPLWFEAATLLAFYTGQRINAVLSLKWDQIDERAGIVDFNAGITQRGRRKARAVLPVTPGIRAVLDASKRFGPYVLHKDDISYDAPTYVMFLAHWKRMCKQLGIDGATPHTIRHSVATNLVRANVPLAEVSKLLGHKSITTTENVYAKYAPEYARAAMGVAERLVPKKEQSRWRLTATCTRCK